MNQISNAITGIKVRVSHVSEVCHIYWTNVWFQIDNFKSKI